MEDFTMYAMSFLTLNMLILIGLFVVSVIAPLVQTLLLAPVEKNAEAISETFLQYTLFLNIGCAFVVGFAGQLLYGQEIARCVSWPASPFQYELGFSELALGILGLLSPLFTHQFWLATIICASVWLWGTAGVQLYSVLSATHSLAAVDFGTWWNSALPFWLGFLYTLSMMYYTEKKVKLWFLPVD
jgi:hypothetical protein